MEAMETLICCGCLSTDRKITLSEDVSKTQSFLEIVNEKHIDFKSYEPVWLCWECDALLKRFSKFKQQARHAYWSLQNRDKLNTNLPQSKLSKQLVHILDYFPKTQENGIQHEILTTIKEEELEIKETIIPVIVSYNSMQEHDTIQELITIQESDTMQSDDNLSDDDDKLLINFTTKIKKRKKDKLTNNVRKKKKKQQITEKEIQMEEAQKDICKEIELNTSEIEEERRCMILREEYGNSIFKCEKCITSFPNVDDFNDHVTKKHDPQAPYKCAICECTFAKESSYNYHTNKHKRRFECMACMERCSSRRAAEKHYDLVHCHGPNLDYEMLSKKKEQTDIHSESNGTADKSFPCSVCNKTFRWKTSLRKHAETHTIAAGLKRMPYCEPCRMSFTSTANLQKHVKTSSKHQIQLKIRKLKETLPEDSSNPETEKARLEQIKTSINSKREQFACPQCDKRFQWRGNLLRHIHSHAARAAGELVCHPCNRTFSSIATYRQHLSISKKHVSEDDFKYVCDVCNKRFVNKTRLKDHVDWDHRKTYSHSCEHCHKVFKSHTSLYLHMQVVHRKDNAEHLCDHCGKPFPNKAKLRCHITALHSGVTPYKCGTCLARFSWHSCLSRHVRRAHRNAPK